MGLLQRKLQWMFFWLHFLAVFSLLTAVHYCSYEKGNSTLTQTQNWKEFPRNSKVVGHLPKCTTWQQEHLACTNRALKIPGKKLSWPRPPGDQMPTEHYNFTVITHDNITVRIIIIKNFPLMSDWIGWGGSLWLSVPRVSLRWGLIAAVTMQTQQETFPATCKHMLPGHHTVKRRAFSNGPEQFLSLHFIWLLHSCLFSSQR